MEEHQNLHYSYAAEPQVEPEIEQQEEINSSEPVQEEVQAKPMSDEERNLVALRNARNELEKKNRELEKRLRQIEEAQKAQASQSNYDPEDLVQRRYVDERVQQLEKQVQQTTMEYRIKTQYPDFDKVVNDATIAALKEKNPALATAIGQTPDIYSQASAAYEAIKSLGIYTQDTYSADRERAQYNTNKPRSSHQLGVNAKSSNPLSTVNSFTGKLTDEYKQNVWKEMQQYMKQAQ